MLTLIVSIFMAIAAGITAFLLIASGDMKTFKKTFGPRPKKQLPLVTPDGKLIDSKEELDAQLGALENKLITRKGEMETSKSKVSQVVDNIEKLSSASVEVRKYYQKLKDEVLRSEKECRELQKQIEDYQKRQHEIRKQMERNDKHFKDLLQNVRGDNNTLSATLSASSSTSSKAWNNDVPTGMPTSSIANKESNEFRFDCRGNEKNYQNVASNKTKRIVSSHKIKSQKRLPNELDLMGCICQPAAKKNQSLPQKCTKAIAVNQSTNTLNEHIKTVKKPATEDKASSTECSCLKAKTNQPPKQTQLTSLNNSSVKTSKSKISNTSASSQSSVSSSSSKKSCSNTPKTKQSTSCQKLLCEGIPSKQKCAPRPSSAPVKPQTKEKQRVGVKKRPNAPEVLHSKVFKRTPRSNNDNLNTSSSALNMVDLKRPNVSIESFKSSSLQSVQEKTNIRHNREQSKQPLVRDIAPRKSHATCAFSSGTCLVHGRSPSSGCPREENSLLAKFGISVKKEKVIEKADSRGGIVVREYSRLSYT